MKYEYIHDDTMKSSQVCIIKSFHVFTTCIHFLSCAAYIYIANYLQKVNRNMLHYNLLIVTISSVYVALTCPYYPHQDCVSPPQEVQEGRWDSPQEVHSEYRDPSDGTSAGG